MAAELRYDPLAPILTLQRHNAQHTCRRGHRSRSGIPPARDTQGAPNFAMQAKRCGTVSTFGGSQGKPPPLSLVPLGSGGLTHHPAPQDPWDKSIPLPKQCWGPLCLTGCLGIEGNPAAAGLHVVPTGCDGACSDTTDPGLAWREKNHVRGCLALAGPGAQLEDYWHSMARDPQPQSSSHAEGELETADTDGIIPSSGVSQGSVAAHSPVTKHSPSLRLKAGTQEHPSSQCSLSPRLAHLRAVPPLQSAQRSLH